MLRDRHGAEASTNDAWTLPVLYARKGAFELVLAGPGGAAATTQELGEKETLGGIVDVLGESAPSELLDDLRGLMPPQG